LLWFAALKRFLLNNLCIVSQRSLICLRDDGVTDSLGSPRFCLNYGAHFTIAGVSVIQILTANGRNWGGPYQLSWPPRTLDVMNRTRRIFLVEYTLVVGGISSSRQLSYKTCTPPVTLPPFCAFAWAHQQSSSDISVRVIILRKSRSFA
jgi:hypothetical protein